MRTLAIRTLALVAGLVALLGSTDVRAAEFELNMGSLAPDGTPWMDLLKRFEREVEAESGGRIDVIIRPAGIMGEVEMVRESRSGQRLQGCAVTTGAIASGGPIPQLSLVELPFLFKNDAQADYVLDKVLFSEYSDILYKRGFVLGAWSENGWRSMGTKGKPALTPEALKQFKMRSQESSVHLEMYKAFGTQAVQKPMTEVLTALNAGMIDGLDNTALYILAGGLAEPLDHFVLTRHIYQPAAIVFSRVWFDKLPADLQELLRSKRNLGPAGRKMIRDAESEMLEVFATYDVQVHELTDSQREAFAKIARPIHARVAAGIPDGPRLLGKIQAGIAASN